MKKHLLILSLFLSFKGYSQDEEESPFEDNTLEHIMQQKPYDSPFQSRYEALPNVRAEIAQRVRDNFNDWFGEADKRGKCKGCPINTLSGLLVASGILYASKNLTRNEKQNIRPHTHL